MDLKLTLGAGSETEELSIGFVNRSLANEIARILNLSTPFPPASSPRPLPRPLPPPPLPPRWSKSYDIYDDDAWLVSHLYFYPGTQTVKISAGYHVGWNVSLDFERTVRLQDIADIRGEIDFKGTSYSYRFIVVLQSGECLIVMEDGYGGSDLEELEKTVNAEVAQMRKFLHECSCFDVK